MQAGLPGLDEIAHAREIRGALVISNSPSENGHEAVASPALHPTGVKLFLAHGPRPAAFDARELRRGSGRLVRCIELESPADFDRSEVETLIAAALKRSNVRPAARSVQPLDSGRASNKP